MFEESAVRNGRETTYSVICPLSFVLSLQLKVTMCTDGKTNMHTMTKVLNFWI